MSKTLLLLSPMVSDLQKGRSDRNGLLPQRITYVREGRTITRKQWVRSEFADHAKKNEEEKGNLMAHAEEKKAQTRRNAEADDAMKRENADRRSSIKHLRSEDKVTHAVGKDHINKVKKLGAQEARQLEKDEKKRRRHTAHTIDKHSAYGQSDQTKADNKAQQNAATGYTPASKK